MIHFIAPFLYNFFKIRIRSGIAQYIEENREENDIFRKMEAFKTDHLDYSAVKNPRF